MGFTAGILASCCFGKWANAGEAIACRWHPNLLGGPSGAAKPGMGALFGQAQQEIANRRRGPAAATHRSEAACVERRGDAAGRGGPSGLDFANNREQAAGEPIVQTPRRSDAGFRYSAVVGPKDQVSADRHEHRPVQFPPTFVPLDCTFQAYRRAGGDRIAATPRKDLEKS